MNLLCVFFFHFVFQSSPVMDPLILILATTSTLCALFAIFVVCELCERVNNAHLSIAHVVDQFNWYEFPDVMLRLLPTIFINVNETVEFNCFGTMACNRDTFRRVSNLDFIPFDVDSIWVNSHKLNRFRWPIQHFHISWYFVNFVKKIDHCQRVSDLSICLKFPYGFKTYSTPVPLALLHEIKKKQNSFLNAPKNVQCACFFYLQLCCFHTIDSIFPISNSKIRYKLAEWFHW